MSRRGRKTEGGRKQSSSSLMDSPKLLPISFLCFGMVGPGFPDLVFPSDSVNSVRSAER